MIISGGVNLYPAEVENFLIDHPAVDDVACIGIPHPEMGEEMRALIVLTDGHEATEAEIVAYCRERLSTFKCPRSVDFVETLGRNAMGKISRRALRAPYWNAT